MNEIRKFVLLVRLNAAWPLSDWRPIDVEPLDATAWKVTYQRRQTGEIETSGLLKSELERAECNMYGGIYRHVISARQDADGVVLSMRYQRTCLRKAMRWNRD